MLRSKVVIIYVILLAYYYIYTYDYIQAMTIPICLLFGIADLTGISRKKFRLTWYR